MLPNFTRRDAIFRYAPLAWRRIRKTTGNNQVCVSLLYPDVAFEANEDFDKDEPQVEIHLIFLNSDDLSELMELQEVKFPITATIQDVLDRAKCILRDETSFHDLNIESANIVNVKPSIPIEVWEKRRNLEYYLLRNRRGDIIRHELDIETRWTWTDDPSYGGRGGV